MNLYPLSTVRGSQTHAGYDSSMVGDNVRSLSDDDLLLASFFAFFILLPFFLPFFLPTFYMLMFYIFDVERKEQGGVPLQTSTRVNLMYILAVVQY